MFPFNDELQDDVNRGISTDLLINQASERSNHQYIFLTPKDLDLSKHSNFSIFRCGNFVFLNL